MGLSGLFQRIGLVDIDLYLVFLDHLEQLFRHIEQGLTRGDVRHQ